MPPLPQLPPIKRTKAAEEGEEQGIAPWTGLGQPTFEPPALLRIPSSKSVGASVGALTHSPGGGRAASHGSPHLPPHLSPHFPPHLPPLDLPCVEGRALVQMPGASPTAEASSTFIKGVAPIKATGLAAVVARDLQVRGGREGVLLSMA